MMMHGLANPKLHGDLKSRNLGIPYDNLKSSECKVFTVNNFELSAYLNLCTNRLAQAFLMEKHTSL